MNLANNKKIWICVGAIGLLLIPLYFYLLRTGAFIHLGDDLLLIPLEMTEGPAGRFKGTSAGIYVVSPSEKSQLELFFKDPAATSFDFPLVQDKKFFCVGYDWIDKKELSRLYMVDPILPENNQGKVIMEVDGHISFPVIAKNLKTIYYLKEYKLYRWDCEFGKEETVNDCKVYSRFLLDSDENIFYIVDKK